jgi:hypothetical protein
MELLDHFLLVVAPPVAWWPATVDGKSRGTPLVRHPYASQGDMCNFDLCKEDSYPFSIIS